MSAAPRVRALLLPGLYDSGPEHWQTYWEREDPTFVRVVQKEWEKPKRADWVATIERAVAEAGPDVVLVAHSTGCVAAAFWALETRRQVRGAMLVAPSDIDSPRYPTDRTGWTPMPLRRLPFSSIVVASEDDQFVALERARAFAEAWGSRFVNIGRAGHINADSKLGGWSAGRALLEELLARPAT